MGKASRWLRNFLGLKKPSDHHQPPQIDPSKPPLKERRTKWSFGKSYREKRTTTSYTSETRVNRRGSSYGGDCSGHLDDQDRNKHALAVADAALAVAHAAAAVVRLTRGGIGTGSSGDWAALKIQSAFRGYLAKRALRALKGLVKLQALVRGHIVRNRTEDTWRRMNVLLRAQSRACAGRTLVSESPLSSSKSSHYHYLGPATPEKSEHVVRSKSTRHNQPSPLKRTGSKPNNSRAISDNDKSQLSWNWSTKTTSLLDDEKNDRILEIDEGKHILPTKSRNTFHSSDQNSHSRTMFQSSDQNSHSRNVHRSSDQNSQSSFEVQSLSPLKYTSEADEGSFCTAENTPQFYSASLNNGGSRRGPFTPTKSDGSRTSFLSGYSDHPNYMSYTESSKAKLRSLSAPKQRPHFNRSSSTKRYSIHAFGELRSSKGYPGSGRLDSFGMPIGGFYNRC